MSLTSRERGNPPPRSKSCVACRRAKRRCDFALPCCLRCEQRGIICDYPMRPGGASGSSSHRQALRATLEEPSRGGWSGVDDDQATMAAAAPPVTPLDTLDCMNLDIGALDPITTTTAASDLCAADLGDFSDVSLLGFSTDASVIDMDLVHQPSALSAPTAREFQDIEDAISRRLRFAIEEIRKTPSMMIAETQTPWCHPLLYRDGMPRSIRARRLRALRGQDPGQRARHIPRHRGPRMRPARHPCADALPRRAGAHAGPDPVSDHPALRRGHAGTGVGREGHPRARVVDHGPTRARALRHRRPAGEGAAAAPAGSHAGLLAGLDPARVGAPDVPVRLLLPAGVPPGLRAAGPDVRREAGAVPRLDAVGVPLDGDHGGGVCARVGGPASLCGQGRAVWERARGGKGRRRGPLREDVDKLPLGCGRGRRMVRVEGRVA
ncbi:fungal zn(2)-Cys(6) binuclear cluster domain-containing protein [Purpureocillium lilacinum]|uniref:Fungal zn(2)-Cys(6) binuclear cluster domain-containing protein n=1 Tax=Purpureocillium lilacinum TaxID=33203 RepID=A0A179H621_PURLI|nr:fungal zn(2)-Cys(6) binuclear cluster domain-containing protein [Purpureocillium lilacinum]